MRVKIWYNGDVTISEPNNSKRSVSNLKRGNKQALGRYGAGARRRFISRCMIMYHERGSLPCYSICLTYRTQPTVEESRRNMNAFLSFLRRSGVDQYAWTLEVQERKKSGLDPAIHYHMLVRGSYIPVKKINAAWSRIRNDFHEYAVRDVRILQTPDKAFQYAIKYAYYMTKSGDPNNQLLDLSKYRLWATSSGLTDKESVSVNDSAFALSILQSMENKREIELENGFRVWQGTLKHQNKALAMIHAHELLRIQADREEALIESERERQEKKERRNKREQEKRRQKALFGS